MAKVKVLHVITCLDTGGAEMMLYRLVSHTDRDRFQTEVVSLIDAGPIGPKIEALGVPVRSLGMRQGVPNPLAVLRLATWLRQDPPDVIQTWMYHSDLVGGLAAKLAGGMPVAWGIHSSNLDPQGSKRTTIWTAKISARLSRWLPARIVCCSEVSQRIHAQLGYAADRMVVIPNGFDLTAFVPDPGARQSVRKELGIPPEAVLIGSVARFDPQKDHRNFVQAAGELDTRIPESHFLLCGTGITWENTKLAGWIDAEDIRDRCHLLGRREDVPRLMAALDIATTSSAYGEAFPLVVGEAMACGIPCVVTDVGDSGIIVGDTGIVVPPRDPQALAAGWSQLLEMSQEERFQLGLVARQRIMEKYSMEKITKQYEGVYESLVKEGEAHAI